MSKFEQQRREKLQKIRDCQIDPYGGRFDDVMSAETAKAGYVDGREDQHVPGVPAALFYCGILGN